MKSQLLTFTLPTCKIILLFTCFSLSGIHSLKSQENAAIDSLLRVIAMSKEDTSKVKTLVDLSNEYLRNKDVVQAGKYVKEAKSLAEKLNFKRGLVRVFIVMGNLESNQHQDSLALAQYNIALQLAKDIQEIDLMAWINRYIAFIYEKQYDYLTAIRHRMEARELYESLANDAKIARSNVEIATNYYLLGDYKESLKYYELALKGKEKLKDKQGIADVKRQIGTLHGKMGNYPDALAFQLEALKLNEELGNQYEIGQSHNDLGIIYLYQSQFDDALHHFLLAHKIFIEVGAKQRIGNSSHSIGSTYDNKGEFDKAIEYYLLAIGIWEELDDKAYLYVTYNNLGSIYLLQGRMGEAKKYMEAATKISEELGDISAMGDCYINLGQLAISLDSLEEAQKYLFKALHLHKESGNTPSIIVIYNRLAYLDSIRGDFEQSLAYYKLYTAYQDSVYNETNTKAFDELQIRYETEKKDKEIQSLESQQAIKDLQLKVQRESINRIESENALNRNQLLLFENESQLQQLELEKNKIAITLQKTETQLQMDKVSLLSKESEIKGMRLKKQTMLKNYLLIGIGCTMLVGFFVYRNHTTRQKLKLQILRNKIANDLHDDVGSTLTSISIFSEMAQAQSKEVIPLLNTIQESSRKMLEAMADIVWTINPENDQFEKIIMRMRNFAFELLGAREIDFEFNADEEINNMKLPMDVRKNLYLIFKEAINNMVKYSGASEAEFSIKNVEDKVVLTIRDNGKGFDMNQPLEGNGIKSMRKRAAEMGADFILRSLPGEGTSIELKVAV